MKNKNYYPSWLLLAIVIFLTGNHVAAAQASRSQNKSANVYHNNYQRIDAGTDHSLQIRNGTLWACGVNVNGELGVGTASVTTSATPLQVGTFTDWVSISAGNSISAGIRANGTLWTWGLNNYYQLGIGSTDNQLSPVQVGTATDWVFVTCGFFHMLAIKSDGTLWAWGENGTGELGDGTLISRSSPVQVGTANDWVSAAAGYSQSLAIKANGTLWAWGSGSDGELGTGSLVHSATSPVQVGTSNKWISVNCGPYTSFGIQSNGTLWAWGKNYSGQLGDGTFFYENVPVQVGSAQNWAWVSGGENHTIAAKSDGTLWSWGDNNLGLLGDGTTVTHITPAQVGTAADWIGICTGPAHNFALKSDGTLWAWGLNQVGQLGDGTYIGKNTPIQVDTDPRTWISFTGGQMFTMAVKSGGTLWGWGYNNFGQLGIGTTVSKNSPVQVDTASNWVAVTCGQSHTVALQSNGTLWTWGFNHDGELGDGTTIDRNIPAQVGTATDWVSVSAGYYYTVAIKSDGTLWAWGKNSFGVLGDGTTTNRLSPVQIGTAADWVSVSSSANHTLGLKSDGTLWAWGINTWGELGTGGSPQSTSPVQVGSETNWVSISVGNATSYAIKSNGTLWAWGYNDHGEVGNGTTTNVLTPVQIGNATNWISVTSDASAPVTSAINSSGELWAWGLNYWGALGDGTNTDKSSLEQISDQSGVVYAGMGEEHGGIIKADRSVICMTGYNTQGQLGNGGNVNTNVYGCNVYSSTCINPAQPALSASSTTNCGTQSTTLSIQSGNLNGAANWQWYTGSCGGTSVGSGTSINVSPSTTNTYYTRGEGGCVSAGSCASITITVNTPQNWYLDADNDGYYFSGPVSACSSPGAGYNTTATQSGDCNDNDNTKWQSAYLAIDNDGDGHDNGIVPVCYGATIPPGYSLSTFGSDCNDNDATVYTISTWYLDADNDHYNVGSETSCESPGPGYNTTATQSGDCDDNDSTKWHSALLYIDHDNDGYNTGSETVCFGLTFPTGYATTTYGSDCDDNNPFVHATETWYLDADWDGHYSDSQSSCGNPGSGYALYQGISGDCDDADYNVWQSATFYIDNDHDGYDNGTASACYGTTIPLGYSSNTSGSDCDDNDNSKWHSFLLYIDHDYDGYNTGSETVCFGSTFPAGYEPSTYGSDCDDNNPFAHEAETWYLDADWDGHYASSQSSCGSPGTGYALYQGISGDCDDADYNVWQSATLYIDYDHDGYDNGTTVLCYGWSFPGWCSATTLGSDCNDYDAFAHEVQTWYLDEDGDGHYTDSLSSCGYPAGGGYTTTVTSFGDCNDFDYYSWQSALLYVDEDGDGYYYDNGAADPRVTVCYGNMIPFGYSLTTSGVDCNDYNASVHTAQQFYIDVDLDGYDNGSTTICYGTTIPSGYTATTSGSDCNDNDAQVNPAATEICNGIDDDCDFAIDEGGVTASITAAGPISFCGEGSVVLNASSYNAAYTYQWYDTNGLIPGETGGSYTATATGTYYVEVKTSSCSGISNAITVTENTAPATSITPAGPFILCKGITVSLSATTGSGLSYQWFKGSSLLAGETNPTYTVGANNGKTYKVLVTNSSGCSSTSNVVSVTRLPTPIANVITLNPSNNPDLCVNGKVKLRGNGSSEISLGYQWTYNGSNISGATSRDYTVTVTGSYRVQITNLATGCSKLSNPVSVISSCKENEAADKPGEELALYPNPTNGHFILELNMNANADGDAIIQVFNSLGQSVVEDHVTVVNGELQKEIWLPNEAASGIYLVRIAYDKEVFNKQIIYQK